MKYFQLFLCVAVVVVVMLIFGNTFFYYITIFIWCTTNIHNIEFTKKSKFVFSFLFFIFAFTLYVFHQKFPNQKWISSLWAAIFRVFFRICRNFFSRLYSGCLFLCWQDVTWCDVMMNVVKTHSIWYKRHTHTLSYTDTELLPEGVDFFSSLRASRKTFLSDSYSSSFVTRNKRRKRKGNFRFLCVSMSVRLLMPNQQ